MQAGQEKLDNAAMLARAELPVALLNWWQRLDNLDIKLVNIAYANLADWGSRSFRCGDERQQEKLDGIWAELCSRLSQEQPVAIQRDQQSLFVAYLVTSGAQLKSILGCQLEPPYNEKTLQLVQNALGWLQASIYAQNLQAGQVAVHLMELMGYVLSQANSRMAAQEWINRTISWLRAESDTDLKLSLSLFSMKDAVANWWVSSDMAWAEKGSATMQHAKELATQATIEGRVQQQHGWWALPVVDMGEVHTVLVAYQPAAQAVDIPARSLEILKTSVVFAESVLRRWLESEKGLLAHTLQSSRQSWQKITGRGYYTWKVAVAFVLLILAVITLVPVNDLVDAKLSVEGKTRWVLTAPAQGFLVQVHARPGDQVKQGEVLAALDDRELRIEQAQYQSQMQQSADRFRLAMAENDASESGIAANELQQNQAKLDAVNLRIARLTIKSPINGIVTNGDWSQQIGVPIENGKQLFEVANQDAYRVVLQVSDADIDRIRLGQQGYLKLTSAPDHTYQFQIDRVTPVASVQNGQNGFRVEAVWLQSPPALNPGMQGVGKVVVGETSLLSRWTQRFIDWVRIKLWSFW